MFFYEPNPKIVLADRVGFEIKLQKKIAGEKTQKLM